MGAVESRPDDVKLSETDELSDGVLLSQLLQLLARRPKKSIPLADLWALLPNNVRKRAEDHGGFKGWLQMYPSLFQVAGDPGRETLVLAIHSSSERLPTRHVDSPSSEPQQEPDPGATPEPDRQAERADPPAAIGPPTGGVVPFDEEANGHLAIQLRGLPYKATVEEIRQFLGSHVETLHAENPVHLVLNRDGRPSGFARVVFQSTEAARAARDDLHLRRMEERYVEVFLYMERPAKGKNRRLEEGGVERGVVSAEAAGVTAEAVVNECRAEMRKPGKQRMLLSMLGVGLSAGARAYLKQVDQGLKHFLVQFPEFAIDGSKGCEYVVFNEVEPRSEEKLFSPSGHVEKTPSYWGTPAPGAERLGHEPWHPMLAAPFPGTQTGPGQTGQTGPAQDEAWAYSQQGQMTWQGWPAYNWPNEENSSGLNEMGLNSQAIAAAVFYGASAAMAAASASQAQAQTGYMPQNYTAPTGGGAGGGGEGTSAAIRLRGLPFSSTEQDVLAFFAQHDVVDRISEGPKAVSLILRASGKSSGQALVQMRDRADAELAQRVLNGQWMGTRYIEVFLNDEDAEPQNALAAATAAATARAKLEQGNAPSNASVPPLSLATNLAPPSQAALQPPSFPQGLWPQFWAQGQMPASDEPNAAWQALFNFNDGQRTGFPVPGAPPQRHGDSATTSAAV